MAELKPCPFCGVVPTLEYNTWVKKFWYSCQNEKCGCQPKTYTHTDKGAVARAWNRRTSDA